MQGNTLKTSDNSASLPNPDVTVDEMVAQVVSIAREARQENFTGDIRTFPNFNRILEVSGRFLLASDLIALLAAFTCGGFIAWATDNFVLHAGFQELFAILSLQ